MSLDKSTVAKIAWLARLQVPEDQQASLAGELSGIMTWIEQLDEVDTSSVEPMTSVADLGLAWRADQVTDGNCLEDVLSNAPERRDDCYVVPKILD